MTTLMNLTEASLYLDKSPQLLRRLVYAGILHARRSSRYSLVFEVAHLDKLKNTQYPEGLSHTDIASRYNIKRGSVIYHFKRLNVKPLGINRARNYAIYDEPTVRKFAKILGWKEPQNQKGESLVPDPAASSTR